LDGGQIRVTCVITGHGHREETSLQSGLDTGPGRNNLQSIASTVTYLERYTLKAALGLAASHDDDGRGSDGNDDGSKIGAKQLTEIEALVKEEPTWFGKTGTTTTAPSSHNGRPSPGRARQQEARRGRRSGSAPPVPAARENVLTRSLKERNDRHLGCQHRLPGREPELVPGDG